MLEFLRKLWVFVRPYRSRLLMGLGLGMLFALSNAALVMVIKLVVDIVFPQDRAHPISLAEYVEKANVMIKPLLRALTSHIPHISTPGSKAGMVFVIFIVPAIVLIRGVCGYLNVYLTTWAALRAVADLRSRLFEHLLNLSSGFFSTARTGELMSRLTNDTQLLYGIMGSSLASLIREPITVVTLGVVLFCQQPVLTVVSLVVMPVCVVPIAIYGRKVRKSARASQGHLSELTNLMHESFTANRIIKAYNLEPTVTREFRDTTIRYVGQMMRAVRANEIPSQVTEFLGAVGVALVMLYAFFVADKAGTSGDFVAFILSIVLMYQPIKNLTRLHNQIQQARAASERVFDLLNTPNPVLEPASPMPLRAAGADIHFKGIEFVYENSSHTDHPNRAAEARTILSNIDLLIKSGSLVALVGPTGCGKTTLTNLLLRFYDPQSGAVLIGGVDIRNVRTHDLRDQIAIVTQDTILFNDSIRANIAIGKPGATDAQIETAARHADAHNFIADKKQGYDTLIGEKGIALSGGQRQRLAIARALIKDAPILILDEATSALDPETEQNIQAALEDLMQGRTTICIAHRLSTIQKADLIVVMEKGAIIETGTHAELLKSGGLYAKLYSLQFADLPGTETPINGERIQPAVPAA